MTIAEAIRNNPAALAAATRVVSGVASPDWGACRDALRAITVTATPRKCGSKESSLAVMSVGADPFEMMEKLRADATGNLLYLRIADGSSEGGVVWAEPELTVPYMQSRVADFTQPVIDALVSLSAPVTHPHALVSDDDCKKLWTVSETRRTVNLLSVKATAVNAWLDALDLTTKTPEEVDSYCKSLLASGDGNPT
jgi:hypothetical protein